MKRFVEIINKVDENVRNDNREYREYITMRWLFVIYVIVNIIDITLMITQINIIDNNIDLLSSILALLGYVMYATKLYTIAYVKVEEETEVNEG